MVFIYDNNGRNSGLMKKSGTTHGRFSAESKFIMK